MKKGIYIIFVSFLLIHSAGAQELKRPSVNPANGKRNLLAVGLDLPIGKFAGTHSVGIALDYSLSRKQFGILDSLPDKAIALFTNIGADYFFGKQVSVSGYDFTYPNYFYLRLYEGLIYHVTEKTNFQLAAGPILGLYSSQAEIGFGANLGVESYLSKRIGIQPRVMLIKLAHSAAIWSIGIRGVLAF